MPDIYKTLKEKFYNAKLYRPFRTTRYEEGSELVYEIRGVTGPATARVRLKVEKFVGGGFAGQVYRVKITAIDSRACIEGIEPGGIYAMKIMIPPSRFSRIFRNVLYAIGFQGPFQLQVNPAAARAGALWQKLIRRAAKIRFKDERVVVDIHATFIDSRLGSCGELSEWIDGRTWRLEVDDHLDALKRWRKGQPVETGRLGSAEYRAKFEFMRDFVKLLHDMGGDEFARQYEWTTCKSQPNCLKRKDAGDHPKSGLVAVDFRAGLVLLPFLPMSPGDFGLILKGLKRKRLVQFDRGSIPALTRFINAHADEFADMPAVLDELKQCEGIYRNSIPDITYHRLKLFYKKTLWSTIFDSTVTGWKICNIVDEETEKKLRQSKLRTFLFYLLGFIPFFGRLTRRIWGHGDWGRHYKAMLTCRDYLGRLFRANMAEKMIEWYRDGRFDDQSALKVCESGWRFLGHAPLSLLPVGIHKFVSDWRYARDRLHFLFVRPVRLYFDSELREEWFREMVAEGKKNQILNDNDAGIVLSQIKEPYIQKYLKSLAVHVCTLPVTQIVSVLVAVLFVAMHPEMPRSQAWSIGLGIIALFQVVPLSPGSLVRGLYVLYLVIKERNFKDYNIAVFLGFFKYIGYLAFPIQMAYRYPVLAGFMAGHWANQAVHIVPVFGESGALLEHWAFSLFYNWPLTIRRRILKRLEIRATLKKRTWHIGVCAIVAAALLGLTHFAVFQEAGSVEGLKEIWWLSIPVALICGVVVTAGAGGTILWKRIVGATVCGILTGVIFTLFSAILHPRLDMTPTYLIAIGIWRMFVFSIFSTIGAIITELKLPDPELK